MPKLHFFFKIMKNANLPICKRKLLLLMITIVIIKSLKFYVLRQP